MSDRHDADDRDEVWASPATAPRSVALRVRPGESLGRPIRCAVVTNPASGFNKRSRHLQQVRDAVGTQVEHVEVSQPEAIRDTVRRLSRDGTELILLNGGDGTIQMTLTALLGGGPREPLPLLALTRGGTSNTIAGDVGWQEAPTAVLQRLLAAAASGSLPGRLVERPVLHIESPRWAEPMCALQFSAGAAYNVIQSIKTNVEGRGGRGVLGPALGVGWVVANLLFGQTGKIVPPLRLTGSRDGIRLADTELLGVLVSTLDHLFLGIHPFWGEGEGALRYTSIAYRPRHLVRVLPRALYGRRAPQATPDNGYDSHNAHELVLDFDGGFTLDGELFPPQRNAALRLTAPYQAAFLAPPLP